MSEDVTIKMLEAYIKTLEKCNDLFPVTPQFIETLKSTLDITQNQQKEISILRYSLYNEREREKDMIHTDRIREKIKELEEQQEKLKYDGNVCFADYEQFCKNLKFLKEQIEELLKEN